MVHEHQARAIAEQSFDHRACLDTGFGEVDGRIAAGELKARHVVEDDYVVADGRCGGSRPLVEFEVVEDREERLGLERVTAGDDEN